jgi:hypothetical protein
VNARRAVGLGFRDLTPELQAAIDDVIRSASGGDARFGDPLDGFDELDDMTMMSLRNTTTQISHDARDLVEALASGGKIEQSETTSRWLAAACEGFSKFELLAIREPQRAPAWAHDAVLARLHVYQVRASAGSETVPDAAVHEILGLCQRLAVTAAGAEASSLVQVANIRADILRALYDPDLFDDESF